MSGRGTSRIHATVELNPLAGTYKNVNVASDPTYGPLEFIGPLGGDYSEPKADIKNYKTDLGTQYDVRVHGPNPIVKPSPDIDLRTQISIEQTAPTVFHIHATFSGDQFPAGENVLVDQSGQGLFLGGYMPGSSSDIWKLVGNADRPMGSVDMNIVMDSSGRMSRIKNFELVTPSGKIGNAHDSTTFTVGGWNKIAMQMLTPDGMPDPEAVKPTPEKSRSREREVKSPGRGGMGR